MSDISNFPIPYFTAGTPYAYDADNVPLVTIQVRENLIANNVTLNNSILKDSGGNTGSVDNRISTSLDDAGYIKVDSVNQAVHNVGAHTDGSFTVSPTELTAIQVNYPTVTNPVPFVKTLRAEHEKLQLISENATDVSARFITPSGIKTFSTGPITFKNSETVTWKISQTGQSIYAEVASSLLDAHIHYRNIVPENLNFPYDYKNYKITLPTPLAFHGPFGVTFTSVASFLDTTLIVYINGTRIFSGEKVYYQSLFHNN